MAPIPSLEKAKEQYMRGEISTSTVLGVVLFQSLRPSYRTPIWLLIFASLVGMAGWAMMPNPHPQWFDRSLFYLTFFGTGGLGLITFVIARRRGDSVLLPLFALILGTSVFTIPFLIIVMSGHISGF